METLHLKKIDSHVLAWGVILCGLASFFWELEIFLGALLGAILASANWLGFRYLIARLAAGSSKARDRESFCHWDFGG